MSKDIKIAKDGFDALSETNPNNLKFWSIYNTFKYDTSGNASYTIASGSTSGEYVIVTHNLGYIPFFIVYANDAPSFPTRWYTMPYSFADFFAQDFRWVYATTTQIIFRYENSGFGIDIDIDFYFKIFKNNLGLS